MFIFFSIDGLTMMPYATGFVKESQRKYELLDFGYMAQWQPFRVVVFSRQIYVHQDASLPPMRLFF
jgi:hypothetical protein